MLLVQCTDQPQKNYQKNFDKLLRIKVVRLPQGPGINLVKKIAHSEPFQLPFYVKKIK